MLGNCDDCFLFVCVFDSVNTTEKIHKVIWSLRLKKNRTTNKETDLTQTSWHKKCLRWNEYRFVKINLDLEYL